MVGETGGSLSEVFRKRLGKKIEALHPPISQTDKEAKHIKAKKSESFSSKETKEVLRKRMMNYGKKEASTRKEPQKLQSDMSLLIDQVEAARRHMTESKNKELERMARGIKPTIRR